MLHVHPVVLDAIEVSRTRLKNRVVVEFAVDLRQVEWRPGEILEAIATLSSAGTDNGFVRLAADAAGPAYASRKAAFASRRAIPLNAVALRDLEHAAGGFFLVDVELRTRAPKGAAPPRIAGLTVQVRERGLRSLSSRTRAAA